MSKMDIDISSIKKLAGLLKETGLSEIEYAEGDKRVRVASNTAPQASIAQIPAQPTSTEAKPTDDAANTTKGSPVLAPMVGTVYLSSAPGEKPFVKVGDKVKQGDTLLIIEAMKVMNPIKSPQAGEIVEVLVSDATPVEFGDMLILIA
jgi:acetyl-CoA carboxylase biotin carboxyl carrier protein